MKRWIVLIALCCIAGSAGAHKASEAYLTLDTRTPSAPAVLRVDLPLHDLERAIGVDANGDRRIAWGELRRRRDALVDYVRAGVVPSADGRECSLQAPRLATTEHTDDAYAVLAFRVACAGSAAPDALRYDLLFDGDALHRGLLSTTGPDGSRSLVFTPHQRKRTLATEAAGPWTTVADYFVEGVWHIWIGFDHLLFLAVLLLPAALAGDRRPGAVLLQVAKVVTAFTLAHSITLALGATGYLALPSAWVEAAIAASIVLAALGNLAYPEARRLSLGLAFGFGLVHGLGFAGVLGGLGLPAGALAIALAAFNVGVEFGQLALVAAALPPLIALARTRLYPAAVLPAGSLAAAGVGSAWLLERIG